MHTTPYPYSQEVNPSMNISTLDIANLASAFGTQAVARVKDDTARTLARTLIATRRDDAKRQALADAESAASARLDYSPTERARIDALRNVYWPRIKRVSAAISRADADAVETFRDKGDIYAYVLRAHRLSVLRARLIERAATIGNFPISARDMNADTSAFIRSAAWRRFLFRGGRDVISDLWDDADVLQGAFIRAIESGDAVNGVPAYGSLFRHIQAERAHLTRVMGAEWRGIQDALHGVRPTESAYPATDDKHVMRLLGTSATKGRKYGTRDTHAAAMEDAYRAMDREYAESAVVAQARESAVLSAPADAFPRVLASVLMSGATLQDVADALGLTVATIKSRALAGPLPASSGIDHSYRDDTAERDYQIECAMEQHAARAREQYALAQRALYVANRRGGVAFRY